MVWKQDLAKLKQQLGPEAPAPKPAPKPAPRPEKPASMDEEDAVFLSAMGLRPAQARPIRPAPSPAPAMAEPPIEPPTESPAPETFEDALKDLKGLKPLGKALPGADVARPKAPAPPSPRAAPETAPVVPAPVLQAPPLPAVPATVVSEPEPVAPPVLPARFQLAAGMAIEVDGALDLRGHSLSDALERLKDRLGDGQVLGWRSLLVTLGPDPVLHEGLLGLLAAGEVPVARYAQAPVPMGGTQAWLLYLGPAPAQP